MADKLLGYVGGNLGYVDADLRSGYGARGKATCEGQGAPADKPYTSQSERAAKGIDIDEDRDGSYTGGTGSAKAD